MTASPDEHGSKTAEELILLLKESEQRYRDLFEEAPIAYVHEGIDSHFLRANRAALKILGVRPDEVPDTYGISLVPDTPEAQERVKAALESVGRGTHTEGVVLELRRKDNGQPIWIQWWSNPDPSGQFTRTMFLDITDRVLLEREHARVLAQNRYLKDEIELKDRFEEIIGDSPALRQVLEQIEQVAPTDASVLLLGETGTGKELLARAIHKLSPRCELPMVTVNCGAISSGLIESELFGHEKGAFTGATSKKIGRFELADRSTIFLDEIGDLALDLQVKLLRVLQEGEFERVGGTETIRVDVRVIAGTHRDLEAAVKKGRFRADLYYRLNVFPIRNPPLRERREDIPALVRYFVMKDGPRLGKRIETIPKRTMDTFLSYSWPGNVRELRNVVERSIITSRGQALELGDWLLPSSDVSETYGNRSLDDVQREHIERTLQQTGWVVSGPTGAARRLGLKPTTLEARMRKLGIRRPG